MGKNLAALFFDRRYQKDWAGGDPELEALFRGLVVGFGQLREWVGQLRADATWLPQRRPGYHEMTWTEAIERVYGRALWRAHLAAAKATDTEGGGA